MQGIFTLALLLLNSWMGDGAHAAAAEAPRFVGGAVVERGCTDCGGPAVQISAFDTLDRKGVGYLALPDVLAAHDAARHPAVMFGEQTAEQVAREFQAAFVASARRTGPSFVSWAQWLAYFQCAAAQAPSDEYFELLMKRVWRAATRCSLHDATGGQPTSLPEEATGSVAVAPVSLLQALQHSQPTNDKAKVVLSISTALSNSQSRLPHRSNGFSGPAASDTDASPRGIATTTTNEFLKGSQFAACLSEATSSVSPVASMHSGAGSAARILDAGASSVLRKLQTGLRIRGLQALVALGRCLRLGDQDGDGLLTLAEFRRALQTSYEATEATDQPQSPLSDADLRGLFSHLNSDRSGFVAVDAALELVRGPTSARRLRLVQTAYQTLARETGSALLDACEVVQRYDANRHPDVIAQRKSEEQCFREFVENFDMEETSGAEQKPEDGNGKISAQQWEAYYRNVSFFVPDDDLFELVVRNTWQLPSAATPTEAASRGRTRPSSTVDIPREGPTQVELVRREAKTNGEVVWRGRRNSGAGMLSQQAFSILQPDLADQRPSFSTGLSSSAVGLVMPRSPGAGSRQSKELRRTIHHLRGALKEKGLSGFITLQRQLRLAAGKPEEEQGDGSDDGSLNFQTFVRALKDSGVSVTGCDAQNLFHHFDSNHDGMMGVSEFLVGVREPMNERRQLVVRVAFDALDRMGSGELDAVDVAAAFDARRLPEVLAGRKTDREAYAEFLDTFGLTTERQRERRVSFDAWERYYANVSATIDEDDHFEQLMRNAWHLSPGNGTRGSSREDLVEAGRLTLRRDPMRSSFYSILDHSTPQVSATNASNSGNSSIMTLRRSRNNASSSIAACLGTNTSTTSQGPSVDASTSVTSPGRREYHLHPAGVQAILSRLKLVLQAQGTAGFCTLSRRLQAARGNALNLQELRNAAVDCELTLPGALTDADLRLLFQYLDNDGDGRVTPDELITVVRLPLVGRRLDCVREAFARLANCSEVRDLEKALLEPSDVVGEFDANAHPDVVAGRRGADHVCREFLETFDVDSGTGPQDGKISWEQWRSYYHNVSASIASDQFFEEMVRNVWHLHSNEGEDMAVTEQQQDKQRTTGRANGSGLGVSQQAMPVPAAGNQTNSTATGESPQLLTNGRKILSLRDVASGASMTEANRSEALRGQLGGDKADLVYAGDTILHAIKHRILQSNSLADVAHLRSRLSQAVDPRTGAITSQRCCEGLNAALSLALGEAHGRALFEHLSQLPEVSGGYETNAPASVGGRFIQQQQKLNGSGNDSRLPLRLVLECLLGRLSPACLANASQVFAALQTTGKGRVFPAALASSFQAAKHPDVLLGRVSAAQAFQDFALNFEVASGAGGGVGDGAVSFQHFETYCVNLRATLGSDELLQLLLRDCFNTRRIGGEQADYDQ
ncbi:hypothetical protein BBJ28_00001539 [Nothophytophthora sp. Chile5]|nr:hypothetical protein BBJ28_00001539 [Nothophytophthora sp. Chile5]